MQCQWKDKVLNVTEQGFEQLAVEIFKFQYQHNAVYRQYIDALYGKDLNVNSLAEIPFLPIRFFKSHEIKTTSFESAIVFESSGTTGSVNSRHHVKDAGFYKEIFSTAFEKFYGPASDWCIIGLLPSYLDRQNSSLVYMVNELIRMGGHAGSGFYLNEFNDLIGVLRQLHNAGQNTLLIGVTFALLDFAEALHGQFAEGLFDHIVVMETGGMKGRRRELVRQEVHDILKNVFRIPHIHSEYGMTELMSQAYSKGNGIFQCPPWMKILTRDEEDPLEIHPIMPGNKRPISGALNIIDLANIYSCSFIATDDIGKLHPDNSFEVLGRMDNSDLRGCSLLVGS
jgi:hypothetical protein